MERILPSPWAPWSRARAAEASTCRPLLVSLFNASVTVYMWKYNRVAVLLFRPQPQSYIVRHTGGHGESNKNLQTIFTVDAVQSDRGTWKAKIANCRFTYMPSTPFFLSLLSCLAVDFPQDMPSLILVELHVGGGNCNLGCTLVQLS